MVLSTTLLRYVSLVVSGSPPTVISQTRLPSVHNHQCGLPPIPFSELKEFRWGSCFAY